MRLINLTVVSPFFPPAGGSVGGSHVVYPDVPFSVEDLVSDHIYYVHDGQKKPQSGQDVFSFYISDGYTQTEAFNVEIDIKVGGLIVFGDMDRNQCLV